MTNKELFNKYPYAFSHNPITGKLYLDDNNEPESCDEFLPKGWKKLFWQCMEDIREPLEKEGMLDKFYFLQVKEKYGTMRLYSTSATDDVLDILHKYEYVSGFVCENCGKPATKETIGWICSYCDDCAEPYLDSCEDLKFNPIYTYTSYSSEEGEVEHNEDVSDIWNRLYNINKEN